MFNKYEINPAYAGLEGSLFLTGNYRSQWQNLEARPVSQRVNAHLPLYFLQGAGGIKINNHNQGSQSITDIELSYNYVLDRSWGLLSGGVSFGVFQYRLDGTRLRTPDGIYTDNLFNHNDSRLGEDLNSTIGGKYSLCVYYINNYFEAGINFSQIPSYKSQLEEGSFRYSSLIKIYGEVPLFLFEEYKIAPSFLLQSDLKQTQIDFAITGEYSGNIFGGIGIRGYSNSTLDAMLLIVGWKFNRNYMLAYSFDVGVSKLQSVHQGTHEIQLNYNLNKKIGAGLPPKIIYNPRYM